MPLSDKERPYITLRATAPFAIASLLCLSFLYITVSTGMAASVGLWLKYSFLTGPLVIAWIYYAMSRYSDSRSLSGMVTVFILSASFIVLGGVWQAGVSDWHMVGGLLPYSDAGGYFSDALRLIHGQRFSVFSSRRPLFPAFLAAVLNLTGVNLRVALVLLTGMTVLAIGLAVREVQRSLGVAAGILMLLSLFMFYRRFIGATLTEHLGLTFGCLAFALLWRGAVAQRSGLVLCGLFLLSLGLNARAGAFLILPAMMLWAAWACRGPNGSVLRTLGGSIAAVGLAFGLNSILLHALGDPGAAYSNFSYTLYGLVFGGNWSLALQQHPELLTLPPVEQANRVYALAWEQIRMHPLALVAGSFRAWTAFFIGRSGAWFSHILYVAPEWADLRALLLADGVSALNFRRELWVRVDVFAREAWILSLHGLLVAGAIVLWRNRRKPLALLTIVAWAGILLSVPFVPPWDADNMRAYAATLPFVIALPVMGLCYGRKGTVEWCAGDHGSASSGATDVLAVSALLAALQVAGPLAVMSGKAARLVDDQAQFCAMECKESRQVRLVYIDPRNAVHLIDAHEGAETHQAGNSVNVRSLRERRHIKDYPDVWHMWRSVSRLSAGTTLALAFDVQRGGGVYLQSGSASLPQSPGVLAVCGELVRHDWIEWLKLDSQRACEGFAHRIREEGRVQ